MKSSLLVTMTEQPAFDGQPAQLVELTNVAGGSIVLMDIGATWLSCQLPLACGEQREVLLGVGAMSDFQAQQSYLGVTVGRYANRIAKGCFELEGKTHQVTTNQAGNCLHGGTVGMDKVRWKIVEQSQSKVVFSYQSKDGEQGFPGNLDASVCYSLSEDNQVEIRYLATTDKATPVNLTNHAYFNLHGAESGIDGREHQLQIDADYYLPTSEVGIPHGSLSLVDGTGFDFRWQKAIRQDFLLDGQQQIVKGYDHSFYFDPKRNKRQPIARLSSQDGKVKMSVTTDKPALQLYTGNWLEGTPSRSGNTYSDYAGVALETQFLPDSPNHPEWLQPSCILKPNQEYCYSTVYAFEC